MPLRAAYDILLHLDSFKNIDLLQKGIYQIRVEIYYENEDKTKRFYAAPYYTLPVQMPLYRSNPNHNFRESYIMEDECTYCSKSFIIKYCNEIANLSEFIQFRVEVDMVENFELTPFYISYSLFYSELSHESNRSNELNNYEFREIGKSTFYLTNLLQGSSNFIPAIFGDFFYSLVDTTVHSCLIDFKVKKNFMEITDDSELCKIVDLNKDENQSRIPSSRVLNKYLFINNIEIINNSKILRKELAIILGKFNKAVQTKMAKFSSISNKFLKKPERQITDPNLFNKINGKSSSRKNLNLINLKAVPKPLVINNEPPKNIPKQIVGRLTNSVLDSKNFENPFNKGNDKETDILNSRLSFITNEGQNAIEMHFENNKFPNSTENLFEYSSKMNTNNLVSKDKENEEKEINYEKISGVIFINWQHCINVIKENGRKVSKYLACRYVKKFKSKISGFILIDKNWNLNEKIQVANNFWDSKEHLVSTKINVLDLNIFSNLDDFPIIIEKFYHNNEIRIENGSKLIKNSFTHNKKFRLFVFAHGFKGSSFDLKLLKNNLALLFLDSVFLLSEANENDNECDIYKMGERLANEVMNFISIKGLSMSILDINFIGHSLGGLVIRAALPFLSQYKYFFKTYVSLGTPHLGMNYNKSMLLDAGMWILQKVTKWNCLNQLKLTDDPVYKECFLYRLSLSEGL